MSREIKNIIFDLGNTLVFFDHNLFYSGIASHEKKFSTKEFQSYILENSLMDLIALGKLSGEDFYADLKKKFDLRISYEGFLKYYCGIFWENKPMTLLLDELFKEKQYNLILLSNTDRYHIEYVMKEFPYLEEFKQRIFSFEVGYLKPSDGIFEALFHKYNTIASETLFVDDMEDNINAGKKLGLQTLLYLRHSDLLDRLEL
ncbi:MAG TPA: HAD-IA family hydrolase [Ignavibacteria bacterium]|nr:HAD-IA family hydrolase [Ignavibacteria bacterium]